MAGDGECWLKRKKKQNTASQIALSYKWVMPLMVWKQRGIFREEVSEWQMDSVSATLHSVCVVLKEYMTAFFLWTYWLKQQSLGSAVFTAKIAFVCVCRLCVCMHVFACTAFKNNYGLVWLRQQQQAGGWNTNSPQMRPLPLSGFKDFCLLSHFWIQAQT